MLGLNEIWSRPRLFVTSGASQDALITGPTRVFLLTVFPTTNVNSGDATFYNALTQAGVDLMKLGCGLTVGHGIYDFQPLGIHFSVGVSVTLSAGNLVAQVVYLPEPA